MALKSHVKFEEKLARGLENDMRNITIFNSSIQKLCLIVLKVDAKFEGKLTRASRNDMRHFANFHQSTFESLNIKNWDFYWVFLSKVENV